VKLPSTLKARFLRRENRFRVTVEVNGRLAAAHLPNSGRLRELLVPGRTCYLVSRPAAHRRTPYDLLLVAHAGVLVSVDARLPNRLFAEAVSAGRLAPFTDATSLEPEVRYGESRLDFRLEGSAGACWVETKSVTLVERNTALFPDAPTSRGRRHLAELAALAQEGVRTAVVFIIQRPDAAAFAPHTEADPAFGLALTTATTVGVEVYAFRCAVTRKKIYIAYQVPVVLPGDSE